MEQPSGGPPQDADQQDDRRLAHFITDIEARLRSACAHLPEEEFRALVESIAQMKLRWWLAGRLSTGEFPTIARDVAPGEVDVAPPDVAPTDVAPRE